jgi:DNA-binding NarL/FixJ family response regulator
MPHHLLTHGSIAGETNGMSYRILVVDDSKLARMAVGKVLAAIHPDWVRVEAANADEAVAKVREAAVDLAVVDFNMPGRDGLELVAELHALKPGMPLAVISANHQTEIVTRVGQAGATFLAKPLTEAAMRPFLDVAVKHLKATKP